MIESHNISTNDEYSYFKTYLTEYFIENELEITQDSLSLIEANADTASEIYMDEIGFGNSVDGAMEAAIKGLFANIGESEVKVVADILEENFSDLHSFETSADIELTANNYIKIIPDLFEGLPKLEIGLSSENMDETKTILTGRITEYIENNGL